MLLLIFSPMSSGQKIGIAILAVLAVIFLGTTIYFQRAYAMYKNNPQKVAQENIQQLVDQVSKLIELPQGETPTVATVVDPSKLKDQPFFAHAMVGDKVLIYPNARKAILYSPSENKIIEVAPLNIGSSSGASNGTSNQ